MIKKINPNNGNKRNDDYQLLILQIMKIRKINIIKKVNKCC